MQIASTSLLAFIAAALTGCATDNSGAPVEATSESGLLSQRRDLEAQVQRLSDPARNIQACGHNGPRPWRLVGRLYVSLRGSDYATRRLRLHIDRAEGIPFQKATHPWLCTAAAATPRTPRLPTGRSSARSAATPRPSCPSRRARARPPDLIARRLAGAVGGSTTTSRPASTPSIASRCPGRGSAWPSTLRRTSRVSPVWTRRIASAVLRSAWIEARSPTDGPWSFGGVQARP